MTSILTNSSSMVALQTLKNINQSLGQVQNEISSGKVVGTAKDNAAIWAISKVMESDVKGFKGISDSLSLASSTLTVAREATESISELLIDIKAKVVSAQGENVDRNKLQTDISALRDQINGIVGTAQFSGLNLVSGTDDVKFLASLDRTASGVDVSNITVKRQDMSQTEGKFGTGTVLTANASPSSTTLGPSGHSVSLKLSSNSAAPATTFADGSTLSFKLGDATISYTADASSTVETALNSMRAQINALGYESVNATVENGTDLKITSTKAFEDISIKNVSVSGGEFKITDVDGAAPTGPNSATAATVSRRAETITFSAAAQVNDGDSYKVTLSPNVDAIYVAGKGETMEDVVRGLNMSIMGKELEGVTTKVAQDTVTGAWTLQIDSSDARTLSVTGAAGGQASGGLFGLDKIDVSNTKSANEALTAIETLINTAIDAAAEFGSAQNRIDIQKGFVDSLNNAMTAGIGSLVDADMEEASARLQALQVQQQLGTQALTIANQQPQNLLSLFR